MARSHRRISIIIALVAALLLAAAAATACSAQGDRGIGLAHPERGADAGAGPAAAGPAPGAPPPTGAASSHALAWMQADTPTRPVVVLLGGSAARESTVSDQSWRDQIVAKGGPETLAWNMSSREPDAGAERRGREGAAREAPRPSSTSASTWARSPRRRRRRPSRCPRRRPPRPRRCSSRTSTAPRPASSRRSKKRDAGAGLARRPVPGLHAQLRDQRRRAPDARQGLPGARLQAGAVRAAEEHRGHRQFAERAHGQVPRQVQGARGAVQDPLGELREDGGTAERGASTTSGTWSNRAAPCGRTS